METDAPWMVRSFPAEDGESRLGVVAKRQYRVTAGRRLEPLPTRDPIRTEPQFACAGNGQRLLLHDSDLFAFVKPFTDVVLHGAAHARRGPVPVLDTGLRAGPVEKRVRVHGERRVVETANGLGVGDAEPFSRMALTYERAFGGDADSGRPSRTGALGTGRKDPNIVRTYPRNYAGVGFHVGTDWRAIIGSVVPGQEDPADPITIDRLLIDDMDSWIDAPAAASYGAIDWFTFPRAAFLLRPDHGPPVRPIREVAAGALCHEDLEDRDLASFARPRVYNCAATGLGNVRLEGTERITLWNLHPQASLLEFDLPGQRPRVLVEPPGCRIYELAPRLQTVLIEPDEDRLTLTWAASMPVAAPFPDELCRSMRSNVLFD